ncbi:hypothetical protein QAD02_001465 [Eretmocerus hayati]|uniref:Uncharacterized protein n=1 Tax=Eretmocerus hayati TaxID=131215 RepID=A0ACC2NGI8_9HYME|nr:hypothetical protein QAD02_001465 [Eretmocerus hayati]
MERVMLEEDFVNEYEVSIDYRWSLDDEGEENEIPNLSDLYCHYNFNTRSFVRSSYERIYRHTLATSGSFGTNRLINVRLSSFGDPEEDDGENEEEERLFIVRLDTSDGNMDRVRGTSKVKTLVDRSFGVKETLASEYAWSQTGSTVRVGRRADKERHVKSMYFHYDGVVLVIKERRSSKWFNLNCETEKDLRSISMHRDSISFLEESYARLRDDHRRTILAFAELLESSYEKKTSIDSKEILIPIKHEAIEFQRSVERDYSEEKNFDLAIFLDEINASFDLTSNERCDNGRLKLIEYHQILSKATLLYERDAYGLIDLCVNTRSECWTFAISAKFRRGVSLVNKRIEFEPKSNKSFVLTVHDSDFDEDAEGENPTEHVYDVPRHEGEIGAIPVAHANNTDRLGPLPEIPTTTLKYVDPNPGKWTARILNGNVNDKNPPISRSEIPLSLKLKIGVTIVGTLLFVVFVFLLWRRTPQYGINDPRDAGDCSVSYVASSANFPTARSKETARVLNREKLTLMEDEHFDNLPNGFEVVSEHFEMLYRSLLFRSSYSDLYVSRDDAVRFVTSKLRLFSFRTIAVNDTRLLQTMCRFKRKMIKVDSFLDKLFGYGRVEKLLDSKPVEYSFSSDSDDSSWIVVYMKSFLPNFTCWFKNDDALRNVLNIIDGTVDFDRSGDLEIDLDNCHSELLRFIVSCSSFDRRDRCKKLSQLFYEKITNNDTNTFVFDKYLLNNYKILYNYKKE